MRPTALEKTSPLDFELFQIKGIYGLRERRYLTFFRRGTRPLQGRIKLFFQGEGLAPPGRLRGACTPRPLLIRPWSPHFSRGTSPAIPPISRHCLELMFPEAYAYPLSVKRRIGILGLNIKPIGVFTFLDRRPKERNIETVTGPNGYLVRKWALEFLI